MPTEPDLELRRIQAEALLNLMRIRHEAERLVETRLREAGLEDVTPAQANVMLLLFQSRTPMTARRIAKEMALSEVTVGRFVRALEGTGWVERSRDPDDARAILIRPTGKARERLPAFIMVSNTLLDQAFSGFDRRQMERIKDWTSTVRDNLDR